MNRNRNLFIIILILLAVSVLNGCGKFDIGKNSGGSGAEGSGTSGSGSGFGSIESSVSSAGAELEKFSDTSFDAFDTAIVFTCYCESESEFEALAEEVNEEFVRYHKLFDIYNSYEGINNIRTINDNAGVQPVQVDAEIIDMLCLARDMYSETGGKVNVCMGSVLKLWHNARSYAENNPDDAYLPDDAKLKAAAKHCNIEGLVIDEVNSTVFLSDPDMSLDVGAIAKGYAVECVAQKLIAKGVSHAAINAGGNVRTIGAKPTGSWKVGIQNPDLTSDQQTIKTLELDDMSVVTSGVYERNYTVDGKTYHHIIDGETLYPENRYLSVSVITEDSGRADALSTALFNMDYDTGRAFVESLPSTDAIWVMPDGTILTTLED